METASLLGLSRADLCTVGRELMLAAHLQDRASIPAILEGHPMEVANDLAIDEWMMASPIYTRRLQRLLGFEGDDVPTIFKGLQLDVGFAHQFMDVGYEVHDARRGEFWLRHCGALADVIPMGEAMVRGMCHDIEDPTFDATAVATNARAQVRPVHRPPGVPRGGPDCHWTVVIDDDADLTLPHPRLEAMAESVIASLPNEPGPPPAGEEGGWDAYEVFDPGFELEHLSHPALQIALREFAIQGHLLARSMMWAVEARLGHDEALRVGRQLFSGVGWIASERMRRALGLDEHDRSVVASVLPLTHLLLPVDYVGVTVSADRDGAATVTLSPDATGLGEPDPYSLPGLLLGGADEIIESLVHGVDPAATVTARPGADGGRTWSVAPGAGDAAKEPRAVAVLRFSTGVAVSLKRRVPNPSLAES